VKNSQRPRPSGRGLKKGNNSLTASIPTLPGGALKGGGKKKELILETDLLLSPRDFTALKNPTAHDAQDLESYLDFLEEIGAFESKKVRAKLYREVFAL